jgi:membrane-associated phospholipid phosphatase
MSASNGLAPRTFWSAVGLTALFAILLRVGTHLMGWILTLARPPLARPPRWHAGAVVAVVILAAGIVVSMFFVDAVAIAWARRLPRWLIDEADEITNFGLSSYFLYPLAFILLSLAAIWSPSLPRGVQGTLAALSARFGFLFVAIALPGLFDTVVKRLIGRARPYVGDFDNPFVYRPFIWLPEFSSMPSGHAATAAAVAIAFGAIWPRMRVVLWIYALVIMSTRVIIAVHHPSDVIAGAFVGCIGALLVRRFFAARRLVFRAGDLRPYYWPSLSRIRATAGQVCAAVSNSGSANE